MKKIDLTGKRFGRLVVLEEAERKPNQTIRWLCKCDCGNIKSIKSAHLIGGQINSCGCLRNELNLKRSITHGMNNTRIHRIWVGIRTRCYNKNEKCYKYYGGRGIKICDKWKTFEGFYEDMKEGYADNLTIDRINVDGDYCKENCRWADKETQANNMRTNRMVTVNGINYTLANLCKEYGLKYKTIHKKLSKGIPIENILKTE